MNGFSENCEKYVDPAWAMVNYMNAGRKFGFSMYSSARDWMKLLFRNNIKFRWNNDGFSIHNLRGGQFRLFMPTPCQ